MREEEFREWLEDQGLAEKASAARVSRAKRIEQAFQQFYVDGLDQAFAKDDLAFIVERVSAWRDEPGEHSSEIASVLSGGGNPARQLPNFLNAIRKYRDFCAGNQLSKKDADRIREYVLSEYIEPARERNDENVELIVKPINDALKLKEAWPNICQALKGKKFQELAEVPPPQFFGADMSSATRFRFDLDRSEYWALAIITESVGSPIAKTQKMASFELDDGRQLALDLESSSGQIWLEGKIQDRDWPGFEVKLYAPASPRHSNLPARLKHNHVDSRDVSMVRVANGEGLQAILQEYGAGKQPINRVALDRLKTRFLKRFPDFEVKGVFPGQSSYHTEEDDYKRSMLAEAQPLRGAHMGSIPLGANILDLLLSKQSNLLGYFKTNERLTAIREEHPNELERAIGELANSDEKPPEAVETFLQTAWPLLVEGTENNKPYGESRILATVVQALTRPKTAISVIYQKYHNLGQALLSRSLFGNNPLSADEYRSILQLSDQLFAIMRDEWEWQPRDLWDVQGFIWVTCGHKLEDDGEMTDEELLRRFDGDVRFREARAAWQDDQKIAFCRIARAVHGVGLDWYHTPSYPVRFGRKFKGNQEASGTLASLHLTNGVSRIWFGNQHHKFDLDGTFDFDEQGADAFEEAITGVRDELANWMPPEPSRSGLWPDDYSSDLPNSDVSEQAMSPTNLILYGPPGTGKTYRTMQEAVRYCGVAPANDRDELRKQYDQLRKEKRIEFVTFHQNFAYEEFVEGLRPETGSQEGETEMGGFSLRPKLGIFRNICQLAEAATEAAAGGQPFDLEGRRVFKMSLGRAGVEDHIFEDAIENGYAVLGWGGEIDWSDYPTYEAIHARWNQDHPGTNGNDANIIQTARFRADMQEGDIIVVTHGNKLVRAIGIVTGPYRFEESGTRDYNHRREVDWLKVFREPIDHSVIYEVPFIQWSCYMLKEQHLNRSALANLLPGKGGPAEAPKQYVLVIDEINRANISKVFGELITLIEPDKRLGMAEELKVRLPYSEDEFGVPANLHIIGTMNTADRSIALLDTALRRRFRFEEMAPDTTVDAFKEAEERTGLPLSAVLETMNRKIEYLVDRDHRIGHAFFIGCKTKEHVDAAMRDKVIPLLQEYFFDDWNRLAAVLGEKDKGANFLECETIEDPMGEGGEALKSWRVRKTFDREAYGRLVGKSAAVSSQIEDSLESV